MLKFSPENGVFWRTKINGTVLKQPIRIEYLIKLKPRGALAEKQKDRIEEVGSTHLVFL